MQIVKDINGKAIYFEAAAALMDREICEEIHLEGCCNSEQEYLEEYARRHAERFDGEQFAPYCGLAW